MNADPLRIILELEQRMRVATLHNDIAVNRELLADTWMNTNANGMLTSKIQLLELLQLQPFVFLSIEDDDVRIDTYVSMRYRNWTISPQSKGSERTDNYATRTLYPRVFLRAGALASGGGTSNTYWGSKLISPTHAAPKRNSVLPGNAEAAMEESWPTCSSSSTTSRPITGCSPGLNKSRLR